MCICWQIYQASELQPIVWLESNCPVKQVSLLPPSLQRISFGTFQIIVSDSVRTAVDAVSFQLLHLILMYRSKWIRAVDATEVDLKFNRLMIIGIANFNRVSFVYRRYFILWILRLLMVTFNMITAACHTDIWHWLNRSRFLHNSSSSGRYGTHIVKVISDSIS